MPATTRNDPALGRLRSALGGLYGERLARLVLFGSRARGTARDDSDYDVAVFLRGIEDRWAEFDRINPVVTAILYENGAFMHVLPYDSGRYDDATSPLMQNIREEGVAL